MFSPLPVPMAARITKYLNKYVRRGLCLIYMSSFYFWSPPLARKMRKTNMRYYPEYPVTVLASHFSSVIGNFRSSGRLDLHV